MKKWYVYELINLMGTIEYVGETERPNERFYQHTKVKPIKNKSGFGKFYGRQDIIINIVSEFNNKKQAFNYQCELQSQYGFETDLIKCKKSANISGNNKSKRIICFLPCKTIVIGEYNSINEASRLLGISVGLIHKVLNKQRNHTHGYVFEYVK
jgi:predicted GIY-YIG superfamily endonuclease